MTGMKGAAPITTLRLEQAEGSSIAIPRREICRYLGYRRIEPTGEVLARIEDCAAQLNVKSNPKAVWQVFPLEHGAAPQSPAPAAVSDSLENPRRANSGEVSAAQKRLSGGADSDHLLRAAGIEMHSKDLARNCRGCSALVMMSATIGPGCDFLIRRAEAVSMTDAAIYQAAGAAMVEEWCDRVNAKIRDEMQQHGYHARPRFSPGYGDLPLELQKDFFRILNLPRTCGISLGDTLLMSPSKSVTAFIGLARDDADCVPSGCEVCGKGDDCDYRRA